MPAKVFRGDKAKELLDYAHSELNASARQKELTLEAAEVVAFLASVQMELSQANYEGIGSNPTVSIGVCEVTSQSVLTERQVEEWAATAKQLAPLGVIIRLRFPLQPAARYRGMGTERSNSVTA